MSYDVLFTKDNLNMYLKELAKTFRKLNKKAMPAEIILVGGASILVNYGFREMTNDIDAIIHASSAMKEAANIVGDKFQLPNAWLNTDFTRTKSYSVKLTEVSTHYKTYSNVLTIRTISAEYLIAMKLMAGRSYKHDLSDIVGILWEHQRTNNPIPYEAVDRAVNKLYGGWKEILDDVKSMLMKLYENENFEALYIASKESEIQSKRALLDLQEEYPNTLQNEADVSTFLEKVLQKKARTDTNS